MQASLLVHTGVLAASVDVESLDPLHFEFADAKWVVRDPNDGLRLPHGWVIECSVVEAGCVTVLGAGIGLLFLSTGSNMVQLALGGTSGGLRRRQASLVYELAKLVALDRVGRVCVVQVIRSESEPIDVDLEYRGENDLDNLRLVSNSVGSLDVRCLNSP